MKIFVKNPRLLLSVSFSLLLASQVTAQTFTALHAFPFANPSTDGGNPQGILLAGDTIYGVAIGGGANGSGTIFSCKTNGANFTVLHNFSSRGGGTTNSDGYYLLGAPLLIGNTLYGTATEGGISGNGTIFSINTNGTSFTVLYTFTAATSISNGLANADGALPYAGLIASGNVLYGTTASGGIGFGTVFKINLDGSGFTVLHTFANNGGSNAHDSSAHLVLSGNRLYGTTRYGGTFSRGTVFAVDTDGNNFAILHNFNFDTDGYNPISGLTLSGNILYGTTSIGAGVYGTIFKIDTSGSGFATLHGFAGHPTDARSVSAGLALSGNVLYGISAGGGANDDGTLFSINADGSGYTLLYSFAGTTDGYYASEIDPLAVSGNTIYGTSQDGGVNNGGVLFSFTPGCLAADLSIALYSGINLSGSIGCTYEIDYATNLNNPTWIPLTTNTLASSPFLFIDTNAIAGTRFYRAITQ